MISKDDLKSFKELASDFKPQPACFERNILIPQIWDRLVYVQDIFKAFRNIAGENGTAVMIDAAARRVIFPAPQPGQVEPQVGQQYLSQISNMMTSSFIDPIDDIKARYPRQTTVDGDIDHMISFLNEAKMIFESISSVRENMFLFSFRGVVNIRDTRTGEVHYAPTQEISIILASFETRMSELVNVASSASESIKIWHENLKEQSRKHVDMLTHISQVRAAHEQTISAKWNIGFQVAVMFFAIIGVILSQPVGTFLEKKILENVVEEKSGRLKLCESDLGNSQTKSLQSISDLESELNICRARLEKVPVKK